MLPESVLDLVVLLNDLQLVRWDLTLFLFDLLGFFAFVNELSSNSLESILATNVLALQILDLEELVDLLKDEVLATADGD